MKLFPALLFSLIVLTCNAQYYSTIKGVIKDSSGRPVSYATIQQVGFSSNGTRSNADGSFTIRIANGQKIRSSCLGYGSFQYTVHSDAILEILLPIEPLIGSQHGFIQRENKKGTVIFEIESHNYIIPPQQVIKFLQPRELEEDPDKFFEKVEVPPAYKGGMGAFCRELARKVKATKKKGRIQLKFFIGSGGYTSNVQVMISYGKKFDKKIVSAFSELTWVPAIQNHPGYGVWCIMDLDITKSKGKTIVTLK